MCLTVPKKVIAAGKKITLKSGAKREKAGSIIKVKKGDWVLTQNGIIIKKITAKQAKETINLLKQ